MNLFLDSIADDYIGASDIARQLVDRGVRTVQLFGILNTSTQIDSTIEAIVISLKTRTASIETAISNNLESLNFLQNAACYRLFYKYCSTFYSTHEGNIGSVLYVLSKAKNSTSVILCPAYPKKGRTIYRGHLI